jgi:hypothetical protein
MLNSFFCAKLEHKFTSIHKTFNKNGATQFWMIRWLHLILGQKVSSCEIRACNWKDPSTLLSSIINTPNWGSMLLYETQVWMKISLKNWNLERERDVPIGREEIRNVSSRSSDSGAKGDGSVKGFGVGTEKQRVGIWQGRAKRHSFKPEKYTHSLILSVMQSLQYGARWWEKNEQGIRGWGWTVVIHYSPSDGNELVFNGRWWCQKERTKM